MKEVTEIVEAGELTPGARALALRIFTILGQAEAKAHGETMETVHFHEVGAVDSIVDIVSAAVCLDNLGITDVIVTSLAEGQGTVRCAHGILPIPVPAVSNIVTANGLPLHITDRHGELVTPTGAAIAAAIRTSGELPAQFTVKRIGIGAGKREYEVPSLVRAMLIEDIAAEKVPEQEKASEHDLYKLESNIDDCSGEMLGYVMERLLAAGARDVYYTPIFMKKNRPAYQLGVICDAHKMAALENIIFLETTTIGIRRIAITRSELQRHAETVITEYGTVKVKVCTLPEGAERVYPEYESVAELARQTGIPFKMIYDAAACS